jgi:serine/threonine-protein kinase
VEGPTLEDRIKEGAMPLEEALVIARQIADALEAAHEKGIIHRDLKPANIKIKPDGAEKVLDFGLAKIAEPAAAENPQHSPTATMGTQMGLILGTAAYMAPEQARGKPVDKRADIWAFGVVLYEMLSGRRLFEGDTISDMLVAVLKQEPDWNRVPAKSHRLLQRCLERDPKRRLRDIGDAWLLLDDKVETRTATSSGPWKLGAALFALVAAVSLWALWRAGRPANTELKPPVRLDLDLGPDVSLGPSTGPAVILSPDGTRLVFVSHASDGIRRLYTRRLDQPKAVGLQGTEGADAPFFSPDGQWVAFFAQGKLKKTRAEGGEPVSLCDAPAGRGGSWGDDGKIVAALDTIGGLSQIPAEGGKPVPITNLTAEENTHRWPHILPGGKAVLFNASVGYGNYDEATIEVVSLEDRRTKTLLNHTGMYPRYLPSGHLVYVTKATLFAVPFDLDRLEVRGAPTLLEEVSGNPTFGSAQLDFSQSGTLAFRTGGAEAMRTIHWADSAGRTVPLGTEPALYLYPRLSPDGGRLAYLVSQGSSTDVWIYDWQRGSKTRLTNGSEASFPVWTRDGQFVVFQAPGGVFWTRADGAGKPQSLIHSKALQRPTSFTPDGKRLVFSELVHGAGADIRTVLVESSSGQLRAAESQSFLKTSSANDFTAFSPDGHWLAYADAGAGSYEVFVRAFPDQGVKVQISNAGGSMPLWSRNAHELFYRTEDQRIMVVNYTVKGDSFVADKPRVWFAKQLVNTGAAVNFDLAPDGKRCIVLMPAESSQPQESQSHVTLVVNFFDEVRRRVAAQGK